MPKQYDTLDTVLQPGDSVYVSNGEVFVDFGNTVFTVAEQLFSFQVTGLKPATKHLFYFEDQDRSSKCRPAGGNLGANLVSGVDGILTFEFYYDSGIPANTTYTSYVQNQAYYSSIAGTKKIAVKNSDETSIAEDVITIQVTSVSNTVQIDPTSYNDVFTSGGQGYPDYSYYPS
jgi:hypothetical protein